MPGGVETLRGIEILKGQHETQIVKHHTVNSSPKSYLFRFQLGYIVFISYRPRFSKVSKDRSEDRFENWKLCGVKGRSWTPQGTWTSPSAEFHCRVLAIIAVELELIFPAPVPGIYIFWLRIQQVKVLGSSSVTIWSNKNQKLVFCLHNSLAQQIMSVEREPVFQAPAPPS